MKSKNNFCSVWGVILHKKIMQSQKFLKYVQECPFNIKCLWLKSKIAQLSPPPSVKGHSSLTFLQYFPWPWQLVSANFGHLLDSS